MFLIKKSLTIYRTSHPDDPIYDASQGDGGASLPGVSQEIYDRAARLQIEHGSAYDMPYGADEFRRAVVTKYWQLDPGLGLGPQNVVAAMGGRDALVKAYQAILALGYGRQGDVFIVSRVPWISYQWGMYGVGANLLLAPGSPEEGWMYTEEAIRSCVAYAMQDGRKVAGVVITSPDNPTGLTLPPGDQARLAKAALKAGAAFVIFDWMYHYVTDEKPMDLNAFLLLFSPEERKRLIFMDGITKSLGGSNVRNAHLLASDEVIQYVISRASHEVIPSFFSQAVAIAAFELGYANACKPIVEPTNLSRVILKGFLDQHGFQYIMGKGYYAFINVREWLARRGWEDTEKLGQYLAESWGVAVVPGGYFSPYGRSWIRFSYATPPEITIGAADRLLAGLQEL